MRRGAADVPVRLGRRAWLAHCAGRMQKAGVLRAPAFRFPHRSRDSRLSCRSYFSHIFSMSVMTVSM